MHQEGSNNEKNNIPQPQLLNQQIVNNENLLSLNLDSGIQYSSINNDSNINTQEYIIKQKISKNLDYIFSKKTKKNSNLGFVLIDQDNCIFWASKKAETLMDIKVHFKSKLIDIFKKKLFITQHSKWLLKQKFQNQIFEENFQNLKKKFNLLIYSRKNKKKTKQKKIKKINFNSKEISEEIYFRYLNELACEFEIQNLELKKSDLNNIQYLKNNQIKITPLIQKKLDDLTIANNFSIPVMLLKIRQIRTRTKNLEHLLQDKEFNEFIKDQLISIMQNFSLIEKNEEAIILVSNLDQKITEELLWELFIQAGPVMSVYFPRDKVTGDHLGYGFVEFKTSLDADYAIKIMHQLKLYNRQLKLTHSNQKKQIHDIGANIFISNLHPDIDEQKLQDSFQNFGPILKVKIMRDPMTGVSKGFGFIFYDDFQSSDKCIKEMNNQMFSNNIIKVQYAFKEGSKGEKHGGEAERFIAQNKPRAFLTNRITNQIINQKS